LSRTLWGPWSDRRVVFDWVNDGCGKRPVAPGVVGSDLEIPENWFIHRAATDSEPDDGLGDDFIEHRDPSSPGGAYAPYQIPRYARKSAGATHLFFALSTWNPYQVVLMRHPITEWERFWLLDGARMVDQLTVAVRMLARLLGIRGRRSVRTADDERAAS
jgi:hypothetical protein